MIDLNGTLADGSVPTLVSLFPDFPDRVFAHWYSGIIRIPQGKILEYVHAGYGSTYERDLFFDIEKGIIKDTRVQENGTTEDEGSPEGYSVAAMMVFLDSEKGDDH